MDANGFRGDQSTSGTSTGNLLLKWPRFPPSLRSRVQLRHVPYPPVLSSATEPFNIPPTAQVVMWSAAPYSALFLLLFSRLGRSQVAQDGWNVPDGGQDDFTVTLRKGQAVPFSWSGWDSSWTDTFLNGESINDLWVTSYDYHVTPFSELITQEIDVSRAGSFTWTIDIPDASLSKTAKYVLRFKNAADPPDSYNQTSPQLSSPGFIVVNGVKSTTTSTPSATSSSSSSSSSTSTPATSSATPTPQPQTPGASGLSTGAKAGIGAGAAVGGIAIIALIVLLVVRRRPRQDQQQPAPNEYGHYHPQHRSSKPPVSYINEAPNSLSMAPAELPATPRW